MNFHVLPLFHSPQSISFNTPIPRENHVMWATSLLWGSGPLMGLFLSCAVVLTHFTDPDCTEEVLLCLWLPQKIGFMSLYLSILFLCSSLYTHHNRDLNLNLLSLALTDCNTDLDWLMPKVSSSCEHKTPTEYCSVKHWQKRHPHTHTHTDSDVWFHLQSGTLVVSPHWLITEGLETWEALSPCGKMPLSDKQAMLDTEK